MAIELPPLPYPEDGLEPHISSETLQYHYGKHHKTYVDNLNKLIAGTDYAEQNLETIISKSDGGIFNNAAQIWNHSFYWQCLSPNGGGDPDGALATALIARFGSISEFKQKFTATAVKTFGSGWAWLIKDASGSLDIVSTSNAGLPMTAQQQALLTCDVWEHAYYIDYRNQRPKYMEAFWSLVNWDFVATNFNK